MPISKEQKIVALVGMCGSGKSEVADRFLALGFEYLRFGQITLDEVKKRGLEPNEANEKPIRENFRKEHGMAAFAILNIPKIDKIISEGKNVLVDGLYSWSEYKELKVKYAVNLIVVAVYAPPQMRYQRLENRRKKYKDDPKLKYRSFSPGEAKSRDNAEIENLEKGGPIAMADYTVVNIGILEDLDIQVTKIFNEIK